jgi:hypothetical protein
MRSVKEKYLLKSDLRERRTKEVLDFLKKAAKVARHPNPNNIKPKMVPTPRPIPKPKAPAKEATSAGPPADLPPMPAITKAAPQETTPEVKTKGKNKSKGKGKNKKKR